MCVLGRGQGDAQGPPATRSSLQKAAAGGRAGVPWPLPPSFPGERAFPLAFWRRGPGAEEAVVILTHCWKINSFPIMLRQLWLQSSSSSSAKMQQRWGERWGKKEIMIISEEWDPENGARVPPATVQLCPIAWSRVLVRFGCWQCKHSWAVNTPMEISAGDGGLHRQLPRVPQLPAVPPVSPSRVQLLHALNKSPA